MKHGGNVWDDNKPAQWLDFSANLRPEGTPEWVRHVMEEALKDADMALFSVPAQAFRANFEKAVPYLEDHTIVVNVAKGIEESTLMTLCEIIEQEIPQADVAVLSGPTHAEEVAKDLPTTIVSACEDAAVAQRVQSVFGNTCMRVYTNDDVLGVELCGAMKNIIALASGVALGLGYGDNTKAALITRGMAEIARLGEAMGCKPQTFGGLAGIGDLIVTATSVHSRNNRCGMLLGKGVAPAEAVKQVGMVVEGINALPAAMRLAEKYQVEMPIVAAVNAVVNEGADPNDAVAKLMSRDQKPELPAEALRNPY